MAREGVPRCVWGEGGLREMCIREAAAALRCVLSARRRRRLVAENNGIDLHMRMEGMQRQRLRDALALAQALDRILVLPHMTCFCDRYWWLLHACRMPGAESMPLPIECPLDHIFDMGRWYDAGLQFRCDGR